ncbi:MAG: alpha-glucan family phosphorylase [Pedosphaera sp.]|nr:alpha-glucan family phosphorylase [Pedosphaera sp.]
MVTKPLTARELGQLTAGLRRLTRNLWWSWDQEAQEIFHDLSPRGWQNLYHNAVAILAELSDYELRMRLQEPGLAERVRRVLQNFDAYLADTDTWGNRHAASLKKNPVAYFSAEFSFHETLPIAAGGLGVLAGDHAKASSDLDLPFIGVSLFYREGYFQQLINHENWQTESYTRLDPENLPIEPVLDESGKPIVCTVRIAASTVLFQAWRVNVGRVPVYLLDANRPENEAHIRDLTLRVYGGDHATRIMQEVLLGVGGVRLLRTLGIKPSTFHMNEGHAAFLTLELIREKMAAGDTFQKAGAATRQQCIFTTHTPVEAGHDRFPSDLMNYVGMKFHQHLRLTPDQLMDLGRVRPGDTSELFCMTVLALKYSRAANGVSDLHGQVSRTMWMELFGKTDPDDVPIGHITNGIHLAGWMKGVVRRTWKQKFHEVYPDKPESAWLKELNTSEFWLKMADPLTISDEELWSLRYRLRRELIEFTRRRLLLQGQRFSQGDFITFDAFLNPDALTIGFARRFATYKRAPLIFDQFENVVALVRDLKRPIQFLFSGKAHPRDDAGKVFIQKIIHLSNYSDLKGHVVFIENYDIHVARQMVGGCDIWLNNPRRPLEASGTSGMKTIPHGGLNLSILDGWWREAYDGSNGFAIGDDSHAADLEEQDRQDSENLYHMLTTEVIPEFFERDADGIPRGWLKRIRRAWVTMAAQFSTDRMVREYTDKYYKQTD